MIYEYVFIDFPISKVCGLGVTIYDQCSSVLPNYDSLKTSLSIHL